MTTFTVGKPRCEYRVNPLGVQTPTPQFGWILESAATGESQTAYQIVVASNPTNIDRHIGDQWASGRVKSQQTLHVPYAGSALKSLTKYYWKVRVWNKDDVAQWSPIQTFVTGKFAPSDWRGSWIESGQTTKNAVYMRKTFTVSTPIAGAYLSICGLGAADVYVNGRRVSEELMSTSPANYPNTFNKRTYTAGYSTYDLSGLLQKGRNCIGVILGNAFYHSTSWLNQYEIGQVKMICDVDLTFQDGATEAIGSDTTWKWSYGAIKFHDMRYGQEDLDMRDRMPGWSGPDFDDAGWTPVQVVSPQLPKSILKAKQEPPIVVYRTHVPSKVNGPSCEFPEYLAGHVRFQASGPEGTEVLVNNGQRPSKFILSGEGGERYEQRFTYQGTSRVSIDGKGASISNVVFVSTAAAVEDTGSFKCSDTILNTLSKAGYQTARAMTMGILGPEPLREKCGWGEDGKNALDVNIYATDMLTIGRKWMWDYLDRQEENGFNPSVIPMVNDVGYNGIWQGGALNHVAWDLYWQYGDKRILEEAYSGMKKTMNFLAKHADPKHFMGWTLNEWLSAGPQPPAIMTGTIQYYDYARTMEKTATALGNGEDAARYASLANEIKANYNQAFWDEATGLYKDANGKTYQAIQAMAAWFGMVPDGQYNRAVACLKDMVVRNKYHPATGFSATASLLGVMMRESPDIAYAMLQVEDAPSFRSNLGNGMCREGWNRPESGWASLTGNFNRHVYELLAGIQALEPGFRKIGVFPAPMAMLTEVECHYDSVCGRIRSNWSKSATNYTHKVTLPPNTTGIIGVPKQLVLGRIVDTVKIDGTTVWRDGTYLAELPGIAAGAEDGRFVKFAVLSGTRQFDVTTAADRVPPSRATGLTLKSASARAVRFQWRPAEDNSGNIRCYRIYRDGVKRATETEVTEYADREIDASKNCNYQIAAVDEAGLEGEKSEILRVTVPAASPNDGKFLGVDDTTGGAWKGAYGADGYDVQGAKAALPAYAKVRYETGKEHIWAPATDDPRALRNPEEDHGIAACLHGDTVTIDLQIAGDEKKSVVVYLLDWDKTGRIARCDVLDGTDDEAIDSREIGSFRDGKYLRYELKGHVRLQLTATKGNAVLSGVFFGAQSKSNR